MIVKLDFDNMTCTVTKEKGDKKFYDSDWAWAESKFLYRVQQEIKKQGYDVIKKRMWKDGHMVDNTQSYIRTRKWTDATDPDQFCIYNASYSVYDAGEYFNEYGSMKLTIWTGQT